MGTIGDVQKLVNELLNTEFSFTTYYGTHTISGSMLGYRFEFNNKKRAFGTCHYLSKKISLSLPLCSENLDKIHTRIKNTILHELAHAFCVHVYGIKHGRGHGSNWRSIAIQIGNDGKRCFETETVNLPKSKYTLICDTCGRQTPKHRKTNLMYACGTCCKNHNGGKYSEKYKLRLVVNNLELSK